MNTKTRSKLSTGILNVGNNYLKAEFKKQDIIKCDSFLYKLRRDHNLTQEEVAALTGISRWQISKMENGNRVISLENAFKLGRIFKTSPEVLCNDPRIYIEQ